MNRPTLTIATPLASSFMVAAPYCMSLTKAIIFAMKSGCVEDLKMMYVSSANVEKNRVRCVVEFLAGEHDYLLFIDSDMTFPEDAIEKILHAAEEEDCIVAGLYFKGAAPHDTVCFGWDDGAKKGKQAIPLKDWPRDELFQVDAVGMGFTLIPRSVLKQLGPSCFARIEDMEEDISFCLRCRAQNIPILIEPRIKLGHLRPREITENDFLTHNQNA